MSTWKPLQIPTTGPPAARVLGDRVHHRREPGDGAGAQVVAVGEAARHDDRVDAAHGGVGVEQQLGLGAELPRPRAARRARSSCPGTGRRRSSSPCLTPTPARSRRPRSPGWRAAGGTSRRPGCGPRPRTRRRRTSRIVLPTFTWVTFAVAERRERPVDRGALRIEDAGQVGDVDGGGVARHRRRPYLGVAAGPGPYQSEKEWPVIRS